MRFDRGLAGINSQAGMQFLERATWIDIKSVAWFGRVHIEYLVGIDGLSVVMVLLTALISFIATISSWTIERVHQGVFRPPPAAEHGHDGRVRLPGLLPVLRVLGSDAAADVLPDRRLGRPEARIRGHQVLPLHPVRERADAAGDDRPLLQHQRLHRRQRRALLRGRSGPEGTAGAGEDPHLQHDPA